MPQRINARTFTHDFARDTARAALHARSVPRSEQSKEVRNSRLKGLESRDKAMEAVLAEAMAKLPMAIVQNAGKYGPLLEGLILEVRSRALGRSLA